MPDKLSVFLFARQDHFEYFYRGKDKKAAISYSSRMLVFYNARMHSCRHLRLLYCRFKPKHRIRFYKDFKYQQVK